MTNVKYCPFIDVLGYGEIVLSDTTSDEQKIKTLLSIYENIASNFPIILNEIGATMENKIFLRSFSDCFYLECAVIEPLIVAVNSIFNYTFGYYGSFSNNEERTPLLRAGIVKDWTIHIKDIGAIANGTAELNPVGLGVARAYKTSEKSNLSGMRIIISPEVVEDLPTSHKPGSTDCLFCQIRQYGVITPFFFKHLQVDEKGKPTDLYELVWSFDEMNSCSDSYTRQLLKLEPTFSPTAKRHFVQTAQILLSGLILSECEARAENVYTWQKAHLEAIIAEEC